MDPHYIGRSPTFTIVGTPKCTYCTQAKSLLDQKSLPYTYIDLTETPWVLTMFKMIGLKTVPQVFSPSGDHLGGYVELQQFIGGR